MEIEWNVVELCIPPAQKVGQWDLEDQISVMSSQSTRAICVFKFCSQTVWNYRSFQERSRRKTLASPAAHADLALDELTSGRKRTTFPFVASAKAKGKLVPGLGCAWKDGRSSLAALCTR